jgi:hypothetical protein
LWRKFPDAPQQSRQGKGLIRAMAFQTYTAQGQYSLPGDVMLPQATVAIAGWRHAQYDGIVALAAVSL